MNEEKVEDKYLRLAEDVVMLFYEKACAFSKPHFNQKDLSFEEVFNNIICYYEGYFDFDLGVYLSSCLARGDIDTFNCFLVSFATFLASQLISSVFFSFKEEFYCDEHGLLVSFQNFANEAVDTLH